MPVPLPPPACFFKVSRARSGHAKIPNIRGHSLANLRTAVSRSGADILSLRPFVSKTQDFARLVRCDEACRRGYEDAQRQAGLRDPTKASSASISTG